jgi:ketosteroid isomerase-like protein
MSKKRAKDILRDYHDAWSSGDIEKGCSFYADNLVVHMGGTHPALSRDFHGAKDFLENWVNKVAAYTDNWIVGGEAGHDQVIADSDNAILIMVHEIWSRGDKRVRTDRLAAYRFENEKIVECWFCDMRQSEVDGFFAGIK